MALHFGRIYRSNAGENDISIAQYYIGTSKETRISTPDGVGDMYTTVTDANDAVFIAAHTV